MKKGPEYSQSKDYLYAMFMAEELSAIPREKIPASTTQAASTLATLSRPKEHDEEHYNRQIPENWKAVPEAKTLDEAVGMKPRDAEQISHVEAVRRRSKNFLGDSISMGAKSISELSRDRAISAYTCSPPAELSESDKMKLKALTPYNPLPEKTEERVKSTWWRRLFGKQEWYSADYGFYMRDDDDND